MEITDLKFKELEFKYKVTPKELYPFKEFMQKFKDFAFTYVESEDVYFIPKKDLNSPLDFKRYRYSNDKKNKHAEITYKIKENAKNNNERLEVDLRVDNNDKETVIEHLKGEGFEYNFDIFKYVHVYKARDVVLAFYSVRTEEGTLDHYIEVEANKESNLSLEEGRQIIRKWEKDLAFLGIDHRNRLNKSLFEMYRKI